MDTAFPIANMPWILQIISNIVPAKWYIIMVKDVMIKGIGLSEIWNELLIILGMTTFFLVVSIKRFKGQVTMRTLLFLLRKEFLQISRNKLILRMIFALPVVQLIILPNAANYEMKNINMSIVDHDHSEYSRQLINKFTSSGYFQLTNVSETYKDALVVVEEDKADLIVEIPQGFERDLIRDNKSKAMIIANAINGQAFQDFQSST